MQDKVARSAPEGPARISLPSEDPWFLLPPYAEMRERAGVAHSTLALPLTREDLVEAIKDFRRRTGQQPRTAHVTPEVETYWRRWARNEYGNETILSRVCGLAVVLNAADFRLEGVQHAG